METFKIGDRVTWTSQAGGYFLEKTGEIVQILTNRSDPIELGRRHFPEHRLMYGGYQIPGGGATGYLIEVLPKGYKAKKRLYMPYPPKLKKVTQMVVFILNGAPRTGKDTFINLLEETSKMQVVRYSSIDWIKDLAKKTGWDGIKDAKGRTFLSELKNAYTKYADIPFQKIKQHIEECQNSAEYFCTNIREPSEIVKLQLWCDKKGIPCHSLWIRRKSAEQKALDEGFLSTGDTQYLNHNYDYIIDNNETLECFKHDVEVFIGHLNKLRMVI